MMDDKQEKSQKADNSNQPENREENIISPLSTEVDEVPIEKTNKRLFLIGILVAILIAVCVVGFMLYQLRFAAVNEQKVLSPTQEPTETKRLEESEEKTFDRSEWTLEILNGSGVSGAAKKAAEKLQDLGYTVIKTDNADKSNYIGVHLFISKELIGQQDLLLKDLKIEFETATISGELEDSTPTESGSTASARMIIGK